MISGCRIPPGAKLFSGVAQGEALSGVHGLFSRCWRSHGIPNNLYWARLADELGYSPAMMNRLVPNSPIAWWRKFLPRTRGLAGHAAGDAGNRDEFRSGKITTLPKVALTTSVQ
jgi:hypothetical protein